MGRRINTKFSRDYETKKIICYICGCKCALIGSREHEIPCLVDWLKKYPKHEEFAPTMPKPYPDPFTATAEEIDHYNQKAAKSAKLCDENTQRYAISISNDIKALPLHKTHEEVPLTERVVGFEKLNENLKQEVSTAEKKRGLAQKILSKTIATKTLLHECLVNFMDKYALHVPQLQDPGRVPKGHQYAYKLDESATKEDLLLHPCCVEIDEQKRASTPGTASLVSRKKIRITAEASRKRFD